jgi:uncharacterized membrane protein (DUF4010 family)
MILENIQWPYAIIFERLCLALAVGLFVGLERQRREKVAGVRTFGFAALIGALGGLLGEAYALLSMALLGMLVIFLNIQSLQTKQGAELTTSIALLITGLAGVLSGQGHTLTPAAVGVMTAALLAWKEPLAGFSIKLSETEIRSAILLAILAFVIYPALPEGTIDPWGALEPRSAWITVILIAGIGFVNYILLKTFEDRGVLLAGFLGGLVNSSVATRELAQRAHQSPGQLVDVTYRGILLAMAAMILRNAVLLAILHPPALATCAVATGAMLAASLGMALVRWQKAPAEPDEAGLPGIKLTSPFSLKSVLFFGSLLAVIQIAGVIGQQWFGQLGIYVTSLFGSMFSSSSAVAAAASLAAHGTVTAQVAGTSTLIASLTSVLIDIPLVAGLADRRLVLRLVRAVAIVVLVGGLGAAAQMLLLH